MRTKQEIEEAINRLKENKNKTSEFSGFGDNKHEAIETMIQVLQDEADDDDIEEEWGEDEDRYNYDAALSILRWKEGEYELSEILYPEN